MLINYRYCVSYTCRLLSQGVVKGRIPVSYVGEQNDWMIRCHEQMAKIDPGPANLKAQ